MNVIKTNFKFVIFLFFLIISIIPRISYRFFLDRPDRDELTYLEEINKFSEPQMTKETNDRFFIICLGHFLKSHDISPELGIRLFNLFASLLWIYFIYLISKIVFHNSLISYLCVFLAIFNPFCIRISMMVLRDPLYLLFITAMIYTSLVYISTQRMYCYSITSAFLLTFAFWTRYEGLEFSAIFMLSLTFKVFYSLRLQRASNISCNSESHKHCSLSFLLRTFVLSSSFKELVFHFTVYTVSSSILLFLLYQLVPEHFTFYIHTFVFSIYDRLSFSIL